MCIRQIELKTLISKSCRSKLLVTPYTYQELSGGVEVFSEYLGRVFTDLRTLTISDAVERHGLFKALGGRQWTPELYNSLITGRLARNLIRQGKIDLVFANGIYGWYLSLCKIDIPSVNIFHGLYRGVADYVLSSTNSLAAAHYRYWRGFLEYLSGRGKKHIVCVSDFVSSLLYKYYRIKSTVIPNCVDLERFRPLSSRESRAKWGLPADRKVIMFVGPPSYSKGIDVVLGLARRNPKLIFLILSSGRSVKDSPSNVAVIERVTQAAMPEIYSASDLFITPSRFEGCSMTAIEAMACNVPILASSTGSFYGQLGPRSFGYVLPIESSCEEYSSALRQVLDGTGSFTPRRYAAQYYSLESFTLRYRELAKRIIDTSEGQ